MQPSRSTNVEVSERPSEDVLDSLVSQVSSIIFRIQGLKRVNMQQRAETPRIVREWLYMTDLDLYLESPSD